ncbi:hypothetical protein VTN02DRAFT_3969 [Thermoascus thermophilus]
MLLASSATEDALASMDDAAASPAVLASLMMALASSATDDALASKEDAMAGPTVLAALAMASASETTPEAIAWPSAARLMPAPRASPRMELTSPTMSSGAGAGAGVGSGAARAEEASRRRAEERTELERRGWRLIGASWEKARYIGAVRAQQGKPAWATSTRGAAGTSARLHHDMDLHPERSDAPAVSAGPRKQAVRRCSGQVGVGWGFCAGCISSIPVVYSRWMDITARPDQTELML